MPKVSIIYPFDPVGNKVGGVETFLKGFIKNAPQDFVLEIVGIVSGNSKNSLGKWTCLDLFDKQIRFFPILQEKDENLKTRIPLSLRFTLSLLRNKIDVAERVLLFNRIEPAIVFRNSKCLQIAFIHNDIVQQIDKGKSEVVWAKFPRLYFILEKHIFSSLDHIYTVSKNSLRHYQVSYAKIKDKFSFLPTWVDSKIFYPSPEQKVVLRKRIHSIYKSIPLEKNWILFVGRLQEQKAPFRLVESFSRFLNINNDCSLIIIGEGNLENRLRQRVSELGIKENVFFVRSLRQDLLADFYRASAMLLLTSNFEGMPRCTLEALGCGLPVVTTNVGEVKRVVKNGYSGEVVSSFKVEDISAAVLKVLQNPNVYTDENCVNSVKDFSPQTVLAPVYEKIRQLYKDKYGE